MPIKIDIGVGASQDGFGEIGFIKILSRQSRTLGCNLAAKIIYLTVCSILIDAPIIVSTRVRTT